MSCCPDGSVILTCQYSWSQTSRKRVSVSAKSFYPKTFSPWSKTTSSNNMFTMHSRVRDNDMNLTLPFLNPFAGYKVITFKNPYLGNTCVPFQHWACSHRCATDIEIPAREEQITAAKDLDKLYDAYIRECQRQYNVSFNSSPVMSIHRSNTRSSSHGSLRSSANMSCSWRRRRRLHCCISWSSQWRNLVFESCKRRVIVNGWLPSGQRWFTTWAVYE
jgi:hypothetical protein